MICGVQSDVCVIVSGPALMNMTGLFITV